jgi:hypothetical protein
MSNRFHSKYHRQNHHTYTSATNPDAGHDPIASPEQPFRGDFVLSGALSCYAGTSSVAGFFGTENTALCAIAGFRGIYVRSPIIGGEFLSTQGNSISAFGGLIGGDFYSGVRGIRSRGTTVGVDAYSTNTALNASGVNVGIYSYSPRVALSVNSPLTGASIVGDSISLLTDGAGVNILKNRTGIEKTPNASYGSYPLTNIVLDVNGDLLVDGNTVITGNLSALGSLTQIDTQIQITSSLRVNNTGSNAAATIIQTGAQPILVCYDNEVSLSVPSFLVDGSKNGWVSLGTATPTAPFTIQKSTASNQGNNQPQIRITDDGAANIVSISTPITDHARSYIGTESNTNFDIITNDTPRITVLNGGNVGIHVTNPGAKLSVSGTISGNSTFTNVGDIFGNSDLTIDGDILGKSTTTSYGAISGRSTLTIDGNILGKSDLTIDSDILSKSTTTSYGAISGRTTLTIDGNILGKSDLTIDGDILSKLTTTSYGAISGRSSLTIDGDILSKLTTTSYGAISGRSSLIIDGNVTGKQNITSWGYLSATNSPVYANMLNANSTGFTVAEVVNVDLLAALNTNSSNLFTIPTGYKFIPTNVSLLITNVTGTYGSGNVQVRLVDGSNIALSTIGTVASVAVDDTITTMTGSKAVAANDVVRLRIVGQSLTGYTNLRSTIMVSGYLV